MAHIRPSQHRSRFDNSTLAILLILMAAFALRVFDLDWDEGHYLHPDERFIADVITNRIIFEWPPDFDNLRDPEHSLLNPRSVNPATGATRDFAYGSLPLFVTDLAASALSKITGHDWSSYYTNVYKVGRFLSALFDTLTVLMVFIIGRHVFSRRVGLIAAVVAAAAPMSIQLAHFYTTDSWLTFFVAVTLYCTIRAAETGLTRWFAISGVAFGLAMASKGSVFALAWLVAVAILFDAIMRVHDRESSMTAIFAMIEHSCASFIGWLVAFAIFEPYALPRPNTYIEQIETQSRIVRGIFDVPFTRQYVGTTPVLYQAEQFVKWGFGPVAGILALVGAIILVKKFLGAPDAGKTIILAWLLGYGLIVALPETKFMRYLAPLIPIFALTAGVAFDGIWNWLRRVGNVRLATVGGVAILVGIGLWTTAFMSVYASEHPRIAASKWVYANVPAGSTLSAEDWDDTLPLDLGPGLNPSDNQYGWATFDLYTDREPSEAADHIYSLLEEADYIIIASNRVMSAMPNSPWRYSVSERYYELLQTRQLGFHLAREFDSPPSIAGWHFDDRDADESFINYDHPRVLIYQKDQLIPKAAYDELMAWSISQPYAASRESDEKSLMLDDPVGELPVVDDARWSESLTGNSLGALAVWVLFLVVLQLAGLPLASLAFNRFADKGWALGRLVALVLAGYVVWIGASLEFIAFRAIWCGFALALVSLSWFWFLRRRKSDRWRILPTDKRALIAGEGVFWGVFGIFLTFRYLNPDSWHAFWGGEKPMEFAFINAMLRSAHFPPFDPWFADGYINYYYYGLYLVAFCMKLTGIPSEIAFNLAQPTVIALLASAGCCVAATLGRSITKRPSLAAPAGLLGALFLVLTGNLDAFVRVVNALPDPITPNFDWTWGASRALTGAITEFPYFTGLYADLHAHVVALPLTVLVIALAYAIARDPRVFAAALSSGNASRARTELGVRIGILVVTIGSISATNAWDVPVYLALSAVAFFMASALIEQITLRLVTTVFFAALTGGLAYFLFLPFFSHYVALFSSVERTKWESNFWQFSDHLGGLLVIVGLGLVVAGLVTAKHRSAMLIHPAGPLSLLGLLLVCRLVFREEFRDYADSLTAAIIIVSAFILATAAWSATSNREGQEVSTLAKVIAAAGFVLPALLAVTDHQVIGFSLAFAAAGVVIWLVAATIALRFVGAMVAAASLVTAGVEIVFVVDDLAFDPTWWRMNTVFKFYNEVWVLLAISAAALVTLLIDRAFPPGQPSFLVGSWNGPAPIGIIYGPTGPEAEAAVTEPEAEAVIAAPEAEADSVPSIQEEIQHRSISAWALTSLILTAAVILASLFYPLLATRPRLEQRFTDSLGSGTLNALDWMNYATLDSADGDITFKGDLDAINWFNEEIAGSPVIAEASIGPYRGNGSRISIHTGLPTIIGWKRHEEQQRYREGLNEREQDVRTLYDSSDPATKMEIIRKYGVEYVVLGDVERKTEFQGEPYASPEGLAAFDQMVGDQLDIAFQSNGTTVYKVRPPAP
jgi:YYY domain-containing protein